MPRTKHQQWRPLTTQKREFQKATGYELDWLIHSSGPVPVLWQSKDFHVFRKENEAFVELSL